jgi:glycosyl transferase family 25
MNRKAYPPIWIVNLARSAERRAYITAHAQNLGLPFEIVTAVDGRELSARELAEAYSAERAVAAIGRVLAPGEIGCALSHLRLYQRMMDENIEVALILEDDAVIHPDTLAILTRWQEFPSDWELLLLQHSCDIGGPLSWWHCQSLTPAYRIGRFARPTYGTVGYLIRQGAARKILARAYPVHAPSDHWTGGLLETGIRLYGLEPPCITHRHENNPAYSTMAGREDLQRQALGQDQPLTGLRWRLFRLRLWLANCYCKYHPWKAI